MTQNTHHESPESSGTSIRDVLKRIIEQARARDQRIASQDRRIANLEGVIETLQEEKRLRHERDAILSEALFTSLGWDIETFATVDESDASFAQVQLYIHTFMGHQARIAPELYTGLYGLDPVTGQEVGPGLLSTGTVNQDALEARHESSAGEAARRAADDRRGQPS